MAVYVVTWNLNKERSNYDTARKAFIEHLEKFDQRAEPGLDSTRWVSHSTWTATQVSEYLRQKLDKNDKLFVSGVFSGSKAGWLTKDTWNWINARL